MNDGRRILLHAVNQWLIPAMFTAFIGIGGYLGNRLWNMNETVNATALIVQEMRKDQSIMKMDIKEINAKENDASIKIINHLMDKSNAIRHHQLGMAPCNGCHVP